MGRKTRFTLPEAMEQLTNLQPAEAVRMIIEPIRWLAEHADELSAGDALLLDAVWMAAEDARDKFNGTYTMGEVADALTVRYINGRV